MLAVNTATGPPLLLVLRKRAPDAADAPREWPAFLTLEGLPLLGLAFGVAGGRAEVLWIVAVVAVVQAGSVLLSCRGLSRCSPARPS